MKYNKLGNSNFEVSEICLGTMTFGEQNTELEAHQQLDYALDNGVNFIDTAEIYAVPCKEETYGKTEEYIGTWIRARNNRDKYILASKVSGPSPYLGTYIRDDLGFSKRAMNEAIEGSLKRLQTDYIDLYQLHWPERNVNIFGKRGYTHDFEEKWKDNFEGVIDNLEKLKAEGKIRHYGLSNETPWGTMKHLDICDKKGIDRPICIQNPYSLLNRTYEAGMAEVSMREDIKLISYSPIAMGLLTGKYHQKANNPDYRLNKYESMTRYKREIAFNATGKYVDLADSLNVSLTDLSLSFVRTRPFMASTIIGATSLTQLKENIDTINFELTDEMEKGIELIHDQVPNPAP